MLKKEFREVGILALLFALAAIIIPLVVQIFVTGSFAEVFFPCFQFGLLFWALLMGNFLFSLERGQGGMEYLLSLPYTRLQLIGIKIVPRLAAVLMFFLIHAVLYAPGGSNLAAISSFILTLWYFTLFVIAFSLSTSSENFVVSTVASVFFLCVHYGLLLLVIYLCLPLREFPFRWDWVQEVNAVSSWPSAFRSGELAVILLLAPFPVAFLIAFRSFDIRPLFKYNLKFFTRLVPLLLLGFGLAFAVTSRTSGFKRKFFNLAPHHKLIERGFNTTKIYDGRHVHTFKGDYYQYVMPLHEKYLFIQGYSLNPGRNEWEWQINRIDLTDFKQQTLYASADRIPYPYQLKIKEDTLYFLEKDRKTLDLSLVSLHILSGTTSRLKITNPLFAESARPHIAGRGDIDGRPFWIITLYKEGKFNIHRLWSNSKTDFLGTSDAHILYVNRLLFTQNEGELRISKLGPSGLEPVTALDISPHFGTRYYRFDLTDIEIEEIYFIDNRKPTFILAVMSLKDFSIEEMARLSDGFPYIYSIPQGDSYLISENRENRTSTLSMLKNGKMIHLRDFRIRDPEKSATPDYVWIENNGVLYVYKGKPRVFTLPDLKEVRFKGI